LKTIKLTRGYEALVSNEDFERINLFKWFASVGMQVRAARSDKRKMIYMHHEVLEVDSYLLDNLEVDHIDGDTLNNCRCNLRLVNHTTNMLNTNRHKNRLGYSFNKRANLYVVYLDRPCRSRLYLGYRKTVEEAITLTNNARAELENEDNKNTRTDST
jgi:hypothetical protein